MIDVDSTQTSLRQRPWRRLAQSRSARVGGVIVSLMTFMALAADWIAPYGPPGAAGAARFDPLLPPSSQHWLGTDSFGHDVLSGVIYGSRLSLAAGLISVAVAALLGVPAGMAAGYLGGWVDTLIMRTVDVILAFPTILVAMVAAVALGPSRSVVLLAIGLVNVPVFCRQVRAGVLALREQEFVLASRAAGGSAVHVLSRAVFPSLVSPLAILATLSLGTTILEVAGLSFLGVAGQPDEPEWGFMLRIAKDTLRASVWPAIAPGVAISLAVMGLSLLGDGLRDALDPRGALSARRMPSGD